MTLKEILQKYITLTTINLDKPIMLCADKKTFKYEYFTMGEGENYHFVDEDTRKYLNEQFANKLPHIYFSETKDEYIEENELDLTAKLRIAIDRIAKYFADVQDTEKTIDKLENVKIERVLDDNISSPRATYDADNNTIVFHENISIMALEHELLHALSANEDSCGLHKYILSTPDSVGYVYVDFGRAINEALTQYFVNKINNTHYKAYELYTFLLNYILPKDALESVKKAYLNSDLQLFIDTVKKDNDQLTDEKIIEYIMNLDLLLYADGNPNGLVNFDAVLANISKLSAKMMYSRYSNNRKYVLKSFAKSLWAKLFIDNDKDEDINVNEMLNVAIQLIHSLRTNGKSSFIVPDEWKANGFASMLVMQAEFIREKYAEINTNYPILDYILNNKLITKDCEENFFNYVIMSNFVSLSVLKEMLGDKFDKLLNKYSSLQSTIYLIDKDFLRYNYANIYDKIALQSEQEKES